MAAAASAPSNRSSSVAPSSFSSSSSILFWNANSILPKLHQLHTVASSPSPPLVIVVAEAKLPPRSASAPPCLPSYSTLSFPSHSTKSSGMVVFIHDRLVASHRVREDLCHSPPAGALPFASPVSPFASQFH